MPDTFIVKTDIQFIDFIANVYFAKIFNNIYF